MKLILLTLTLLAASLANAQGTFDAYLPDATLINYSGPQSISHIYSYPMIHVSQSVYNTADCAEQGWQNNPPTYAGYGIGGRIGFNSNNMPSSKIPACYPIYTSLNADWYSERVYGPPVNDHLYQGLYINADGSLPGGVPGTANYAESCSLIGNNGGVGSPSTTEFQEGVCYYYGGTGGMQ